MLRDIFQGFRLEVTIELDNQEDGVMACSATMVNVFVFGVRY